MDSIIARGLTFKACHGMLDQEKTNPQLFQVDLELFLNLQAAGQQDDLSLTVDYDQVYQLVQAMVEGPSCNLIEALADKIAQALLNKFPLQAVEITVYKPEAPVKGEFQYFAVKIRRSKA
jgi:dihydroneopterin aldolase